MAEYYNTQNILNLPKIETINSSDYLIVQDSNSNTRTSLLQFKNFIIGLDNITFSSTIQQHTDDITTINLKLNKIADSFNAFLDGFQSAEDFDSFKQTLDGYKIDLEET